MDDTDIDTDTSIDGDYNWTFDTCDEFAKYAQNDNYWCWNKEEGDYKQIWTVLALIKLMYAGQILLFHTAYMRRTMAIRAIKIPTQSTQSLIPIPEILYRNKSNDFVSLLIHLAIHILFIFIKIYILNTNYISTVNDQYESIHFQQFISARNILLLTLLTLTPASFILNNILFRRTDTESTFVWKYILIPSAFVLYIIDILFTFVILCIYYSLFIMALYFAAIGLLGVLFVFCIIICSVTLFIACIANCCMDNGCIAIVEDDLGDIIIEFPKGFRQFMFFQLLFIVIMGFVISVILFEVFFAWYCFGGPSHSIFYANFNENADDAVYWLFIVVTTLGVAAFIGEVITLCNTYIQNHVYGQEIHHEILRGSDNESTN